MSLTVIKSPPRLPLGLADDLRELARKVESGELTEFVAAYVVNENYEMMFGSSLGDSLVLSTLLQSRCIDRFKE